MQANLFQQEKVFKIVTEDDYVTWLLHSAMRRKKLKKENLKNLINKNNIKKEGGGKQCQQFER